MVEEAKGKLGAIITTLEKATDEEDEKSLWDSALDLVETLVEMTPTKIDDVIFKPIIRIFRRRFDIR